MSKPILIVPAELYDRIAEMFPEAEVLKSEDIYMNLEVGTLAFLAAQEEAETRRNIILNTSVAHRAMLDRAIAAMDTKIIQADVDFKYKRKGTGRHKHGDRKRD